MHTLILPIAMQPSLQLSCLTTPLLICVLRTTGGETPRLREFLPVHGGLFIPLLSLSLLLLLLQLLLVLLLSPLAEEEGIVGVAASVGGICLYGKEDVAEEESIEEGEGEEDEDVAVLQE